MRPIKFRAWDKVHKTMFVEFGEGSAEVASVGVNETLRLYQEDENWGLMQFTGLHDKNGKEIYEGDVVQAKPAISIDGRYPVVWDNEQSCFKVDCFKEIGRSLTFRKWEVIGNVYENPELLEPEKVKLNELMPDVFPNK